MKSLARLGSGVTYCDSERGTSFLAEASMCWNPKPAGELGPLTNFITAIRITRGDEDKNAWFEGATMGGGRTGRAKEEGMLVVTGRCVYHRGVQQSFGPNSFLPFHDHLGLRGPEKRRQKVSSNVWWAHVHTVSFQFLEQKNDLPFHFKIIP